MSQGISVRRLFDDLFSLSPKRMESGDTGRMNRPLRGLTTAMLAAILVSGCSGKITTAADRSPAPSPSPMPSIDCKTASQRDYMKYCASAEPTDDPGTQDSPVPTVPPNNGIGVKWSFASAELALGSMKFGDQPDNALVDRLEAERKRLQEPALSYVVVSIDNTNGTGDVNMYKVAVVDNDGNQYESVNFDDLGWSDKATDDTAEYNRVIGLSTDLSVFLHPGAKGTAVMLFKKRPPTVKRLFVYPDGGLEDTEAMVIG